MVDIIQLKKEQLKLAKKVTISDRIKKIDTIGGVGQTFIDNKVISAIVICNYKDFKIIETKYAVVDAKIKYIRGFLFYREGPAAIEAFNKLESLPIEKLSKLFP